jgi:homoserine kinase type II
LYDVAEFQVAPMFPAVAKARWRPLESAGGFSGARIWCAKAGDQKFCLKAHPRGADSGRLRTIHQWLADARAAGLSFVPTVEKRRDGHTVVEAADRPWDLLEWMPGRPDFHDDPSDVRLFAAVTALAHLHDVWTLALPPVPCPAIVRRRQLLDEWNQLCAGGWVPRFKEADPVRPHAEAAWSLLPAAVDQAADLIMPWLGRPVPVQRCVGDLWHDHVLFDGDDVTGIIDYGAARVDHVAVDLARLLGSLIPDDPARTQAALRVYEAIRPLPQPDLVSVLDRTAVVIGALNWVRWLYHDRRKYLDRHAVADRLAALVRRIRPVPAAPLNSWV